MSSDPVKKGQKFQNREAFKAHRNIKRAVSDVTKETTLKNKACIGVCRRCVQKVVWRFKYEKYRALRGGRSGNCASCRDKTVQFSYRSLCDNCAKKKKLCPGCSKPPELAQLADGEGAPLEDGDGESTDEEDLDGVVITHLSDAEDDSEK
uniref:Uncharacterized protein n=1 Tax=Mantoniella antarctica TaxID=81844 RepID=A0A7S0T1Y8_9CHLO|mmetsp:Transcript_16415/g.26440  ORF Transcript_16415/g.26440 Transcript_16415/m.26440 type:complete len:150 (-) Transcript_16415:397-846(-)